MSIILDDYYLSLSKDWWNLSPNERRTLRQKDLLQTWINNKARGYVLAVTGFGKTWVGKMAIAEAFKRNPNRVVNIIVPHNAAKNVWEEVKAESSNKNIRICMAKVYLTLPKDSRTCDLLIVDECHRFANEEAKMFGKMIDATKAPFILPLSATLSEEQETFLQKRNIPLVGKVTMKEAQECGYVADHQNYIVDIPVSAQDLEQITNLDKEFHTTWKPFGYEFDQILGVMKGGSAGMLLRQRYADQFGCSPEQIYGLAKRAHKSMRERKVAFQKAISKIDVVELIANKFNKSNILTFGEYTDFADLLTKRLGKQAKSFHTKVPSELKSITKYKRWKTPQGRDNYYIANKDKVKGLTTGEDSNSSPYYVKWKEKKKIGKTNVLKNTIAQFESDTHALRIVNTAKALDEAANIDKVEVIIIVSYTSKPRQTIQRIGRGIRFKPGKKAFIFILCVTRKKPQTQEQRWLRNALAELEDFEWITVDEINDIPYEKQK